MQNFTANTCTAGRGEANAVASFGRLSGYIAVATLAAHLIMPGAGSAQKVGGSGSPSSFSGGGNSAMPTIGRDDIGKRYNQGIEALQAQNITLAEQAFRDVLQENSANAAANFMMGITQVSLNNLPDARSYLERAAKENAKAPDPKGRLGWVDIKLGDVQAAMKQREELVRLNTACKQTCSSAKGIAAGLLMIDSAPPPKP